MKKLFFTALFFLCAMMTQAQTSFTLLDEAQTPYKVAGKLIAEIKSTDGSSKIFLEHIEKTKIFKITQVDFDTKSELTNINITTMPTAVMRFQTDGYGSRVEMVENEYFGTGQYAELTLLCQGQESCFTKESINIWETAKSTKSNVGYAKYYFAKKEVAESVLKEFVAKK